MKHMLHPIPITTPFVTNKPPTLFVAHPLNIWPAPNNEHASKAALRVPNRRINRLFMIAPKLMKAIVVEPMNAKVESGARCSEASFA